jgi:NCS1 family nucleobase:cation symporter-1
VWSPLDLLGRFLDGDASSGTRAGVAFIAIGFIIAQLGTNIAANSISAGCDLTALLPRFINIRRGGYVAAFVGFVMCPWQLLSDSNSFASYLSAYSVFLSSIVRSFLLPRDLVLTLALTGRSYGHQLLDRRQAPRQGRRPLHPRE